MCVTNNWCEGTIIVYQENAVNLTDPFYKTVKIL